MRRPFCLALIASLSVPVAFGCGSSEPTTTVPFKATDTSQFDQMKNAMIKNQMKKGMKPIVPKS